MIHRNNNGDVVLIYNRLDAVAVKTYLRRRLGRHPAPDTLMNLHDAIRWGHALQMNRCPVHTVWECNNTYDIAV